MTRAFYGGGNIFMMLELWLHVIPYLWELLGCTTPRINSKVEFVKGGLSIATNVVPGADVSSRGRVCMCQGRGDVYGK